MPSDAATPEAEKPASFAEFYPTYLNAHRSRSSRRLHFLGLTLALACVVVLVATGNPIWLVLTFVCGYGFAWIGHFFFEKNEPATFRQPIYSFMGDWKMYWDMWTGRIKL